MSFNVPAGRLAQALPNFIYTEGPAIPIAVTTGVRLVAITDLLLTMTALARRGGEIDLCAAGRKAMWAKNIPPTHATAAIP